MVDDGRKPVILMTVFDDGTFSIFAKREHRKEVVPSMRILMNAIELNGADYLIRDM